MSLQCTDLHAAPCMLVLIPHTPSNSILSGSLGKTWGFYAASLLMMSVKGGTSERGLNVAS